MAARPPRSGPRRPAQGPSRRRPRGREGSDLGRRVLVAIPLIVLAIFLVVEGGLVFTLGALAIGLVCAHELFGLVERAHPARLAGFLGLIALALAAQYGDQATVLLVLVAWVPVLFVLTVLQPRGRPVPTMSVTMLGVWWIGLAIAHAVLLRNLPHGDGIIIDVLVGTFLGDTGAYFIGRAVGRRPLAPGISPNKTLEGLVGGMAVAIAAVWFAGLYQDWLSGTQALLLGVGVAIAAPLGDLFESAVKRDTGHKDAGRLLGAHGGVLDRLDAALFALVAGYYIWFAMV